LVLQPTLPKWFCDQRYYQLVFIPGFLSFQMGLLFEGFIVPLTLLHLNLKAS
jgi:hypothetical protein